MEATRDSFLSQLHPALVLGFFSCALVLAVLVGAPLFSEVSLAAAACCLIAVRGRAAWRLMAGLLPLVVIVALVNPLFNTEGATVLFTCGPGRPYTAEALRLGALMAMVLASALLWLTSMSQVLTSEKATYLFGSSAPALATALTLAIRFVPGFGRRAVDVARARATIGRGPDEGSSLVAKVRAGAALLNALAGWAFEHGLVTADSMAARGFGSGRRTSYGRYSATRRDKALGAIGAGLLSIVAAGVAIGAVPLGFAPVCAATPLSMAALAAYGAFLALPTAVCVGGEVRWRCSISNT